MTCGGASGAGAARLAGDASHADGAARQSPPDIARHVRHGARCTPPAGAATRPIVKNRGGGRRACEPDICACNRRVCAPAHTHTHTAPSATRSAKARRRGARPAASLATRPPPRARKRGGSPAWGLRAPGGGHGRREFTAARDAEWRRFARRPAWVAGAQGQGPSAGTSPRTLRGPLPCAPEAYQTRHLRGAVFLVPVQVRGARGATWGRAEGVSNASIDQAGVRTQTHGRVWGDGSCGRLWRRRGLLGKTSMGGRTDPFGIRASLLLAAATERTSWRPAHLGLS